jgi:dihydroorotase (multifunctional complex type)
MFDLGIENGVVVDPRGRSRRNVYVQAGRVAAVTSEYPDARERCDAGGLLVMPGMVDAHVHLMDPADTSREDFPAGTTAAAAAGVTTIIEHTHGRPVRTAADLEEKRRYLQDRSLVDFGLAAHAWPEGRDEVASLWQAGASFLKVFTCTTHGIPGFSPGALLDLFRRTAAVGASCLVHCEDDSITAAAEQALRAAGSSGGDVIPLWRNREAELVGVSEAALLAARTKAPITVAHISYPEALRVVEFARSLGGAISAETCPQYLSLFEAEVLEHGAFRKFTPPARAGSQADLADMWTALRAGRLTYVSSDHAPSTVVHKQGGIWEAPFGLPGLDTTFPVLLDAAHRGLLSYEEVVRVYAEAPARVFGFFPRKGALLPGSDADIVLVAPEAAWQVANEEILSRAGWSPFAGRRLVGRAVRTYLRGTLAAAEHRPAAAPGLGRFLPGPGAAASGTR